MLACTRQTWRVASLARPGVLAFSTSSSRRTEIMSELLGVVEGEAENQELQQRAASAPSLQSSEAEWSNIPPNKILAPKHLTYDVRTNEKRFAKRVVPTSKEARSQDVFYRLRIDPREFSMNAPLLYDFVTEMGKIHGRQITHLTAKSQRLLGKTIRRAKQMGIMASLSRPQKYGRKY